MILFTFNETTYAKAETLTIKLDKNICKTIKQNYEIEVMKNWSNGLESDENFLKEIDKNIDILKKQKNISNKNIKNNIQLWIKTEENMKKGIKEKDITLVTNATNNKIKLITQFNKLCKKVK